MATQYPNNIDDTISIPVLKDNIDEVDADKINTLRAALLAVQNEMGINPSGISTTVSNRLTGIDILINSLYGNSGVSDGYISVQSGGATVGLGHFTTLNFSGPGVSVSDSGSRRALITITGGGGGSGTTFVAGGDLTGSDTSQTVSKIQGVSISGTPSVNKTLVASSSTAAAWGTPLSGPPTGSASGDLGGSYPNPTVAKINGSAVPIGGGLTAGNSLLVSGSSSLTYGAVNLAGGSDSVSGLLPTTNQVAQSLSGDLTGTTSSAVVIKINGIVLSGSPITGQVLTATSSSGANWQNPSGGGGGSFTAGGDLAGNSTSQSVVSLTGSTGVINIAASGNILTWNTSTTAPGLKQANTAVNGATGATMTIQAANATGTTTTGGALTLTSGTGTTTAGAVKIQTGAVDRLTITPTTLSIAPTKINNTGNAKLTPWSDYGNLQTTAATPANIYSWVPKDNAATQVDMTFVAFKSTGIIASTFKRSALFRKASGTLVQVGTTVDNGFIGDAGTSYVATIAISGSSVAGIVTGATSNTLQWGVYVSVMEVIS